MPTVRFVKEKKEIEVPHGANLRAEAKKHGIQVYPHLHKLVHCPGLGLCGTCRVLITKGMENTNELTVPEKLQFKWGMPPGLATLAYIGNEATMRLSCQTKVLGDLDVETQPPLNLFGENFFS